MDLTIFSGMIIPILILLKAIQWYVLKQCDSYINFDELNYKSVKSSLIIPAYIDAIETYRDIRHSIKKTITTEDVSWIEKKGDYMPKEIHQLIENEIDTMAGPEHIFRSMDWEQEFKTSNDKFFNGMSQLFKIKSMKVSRDRLDCVFWILFILAIASFAITIALQFFSISYSVFSLEIISLTFVAGFLLLLLLIGVLIRIILIKRNLESVYKDATKYTI